MQKFTTPLLALIVGLAVPATATDITVDSAGYNYSGSFYYKSSESYSLMKKAGLGSGYYRYGNMHGTFSNNDGNRSGSVVGNVWISSYIGATSGWVVMSRNWGGNSSNVFSAYQSWTCTKPGYRKRINRSGYASIGAHEYAGGTSWPMRDELEFSKYGAW